MGRRIFNKTSSTDKKKKPEAEWVIAEIPAIISPERWEAVQAILRSRDPRRTGARYTGRPTLLSNLARCSSCGGAMSLGTGKSGAYRYYICKNHNRLGNDGCSHPRRIREDLLDSLVVDHLADIMFEPDRLRVVLQEAIQAEQEAQKEAPRELARLERRKSNLDSEISRSHKAIITGKIAEDDDGFADLLKNLRAERTQLQGIIAALKASAPKYSPLTAQNMRAFSAALRAAMRAGDARTRRGYLKFFLASVNVKEREVELCGHKGMLTHAYANDWQADAMNAGLRRRGLPSVPHQVSNGSPLVPMYANAGHRKAGMAQGLRSPACAGRAGRVCQC
jgi:site-specific DNA recombinase